MNVPVEHRKPEYFEPYLEKNPADNDYRVYAVRYYNRHVPIPTGDKLKKHALQLLKHHPDNHYAFVYTRGVLLSDEAYRSTVINLLEQKIDEGHTSASTYFLLAKVYATGAAPRQEGREWVLKRHRLPDNAELVTTTNAVLVQKTIQNYSKGLSIARAEQDRSRTAYYPGRFARFLERLGRNAEALQVYEDAVRYLKTLKYVDEKEQRSLERDIASYENKIRSMKEARTTNSTVPSDSER